MKKILVTGGAGYIGSHIIVELLSAGYLVVSGDNFSNSSKDVFDSLKKITGIDVVSHEIDFSNFSEVDALFKSENFYAVIHLAGFKSVSESVCLPLKYYKNNIDSTLSICSACLKYSVNNFIFSSSATVYGEPRFLPLTEEHPVSITTNPYGNTKFFIEQILRDTHAANKNFSVMLLRYFNPVGAHESGLIGENPVGIPNNLMPYICQVAAGLRSELHIFGNDYDTVDGTGVRDFIHVADLARGHVLALGKCSEKKGVRVYNLGTGEGTSVLNLIETFEKVNGIRVPYVFDPRRSGDVAACWADASRAAKELGWRSTKGLAEMVRDSWRYQSLSNEWLGARQISII